MLILGRGLQGLGAALVSPAALSIVTTTFRRAGADEGAGRLGGDRGRRRRRRPVPAGSWSSRSRGRGSSSSTSRSGIAAFLAVAAVRARVDADSVKTFDLAGAVTVTAGLLALVYGIVQAQDGLGLGRCWGSSALADRAAGRVRPDRVSLRGAARSARDLPVRTVRGATSRCCSSPSGLFAMFFFNTLYVQRVLGFSPMEAGLALSRSPLGSSSGAGLSQKLSARCT